MSACSAGDPRVLFTGGVFVGIASGWTASIVALHRLLVPAARGEDVTLTVDGVSPERER